jgi:hypothetical protein
MNLRCLVEKGELIKVWTLSEGHPRRPPPRKNGGMTGGHRTVGNLRSLEGGNVAGHSPGFAGV